MSVTFVPLAYDALQVPLELPALIEQLIALPATTPLPVPPPLTVSAGFAEKCAAKVRFALAVKV